MLMIMLDKTKVYQFGKFKEIANFIYQVAVQHVAKLASKTLIC